MKKLSNTETELKKKALLIKKACNQTNFSISVEPFIKIKSKFRIILYSVFCINYAFSQKMSAPSFIIISPILILMKR